MIYRVLILALFLGGPVINTAAPDVVQITGSSSFYSIRRDLRRCASPMCGGYFVKLVNQSRMRCANGRTMNECYVASIEWNGQPETDKDGAVLRGSLSTRGDRRGKYGVLLAREVWLPSGDKQSSGTFFRVRDRGIRCIAAPCETHHQAKLNTSVSRNIAGVDLSGAGAPENVVGDANQAMTSPEGIIVAGVNTRVTGPAGRSQMLKGMQFYLRAKPGGGTSSGNDNQNKPCFKTGCSGQVCADEEVVTTCEYRTEYECYKAAKCERQANGKCGFTDTPELRRCLRRN
jgi:eight-cysteine-cluster-containing protein